MRVAASAAGRAHADSMPVRRSVDLRAIARTLVKKAKGGDLPAIRELLNRVIGKAPDDAEASPPEVIVVRTGVPEPDNDLRT